MQVRPQLDDVGRSVVGEENDGQSVGILIPEHGPQVVQCDIKSGRHRAAVVDVVQRVVDEVEGLLLGVLFGACERLISKCLNSYTARALAV